ncbi:MAG: metal ABC transporter permease [Candidatus Hydrogenedentes bacterium]|nr:metal ABC transporter permease [Candidatus Hydrogenedentota bacterium]
MSMDAIWIMLTGSLVAAACALVGCFLVLRRLSMLGDAISHAVLPGIVIAFLMTGSRNTLPMLAGAMAAGMLTAFLTDLLNRFGKLQSDAAIGVTFTWLFAIGVILVSRFTGMVDLDVECVLYGEIIFTPLDTVSWGGHTLGPRAFWLTGLVCLANLFFVVLCYKQLKICTFDAGLAASIGINVVFWHYLLMGFVSLTTVASFESVGAILVVAMLTVPPNTAYLLTDRLSHMLLLSVACGVASALGGYALAAWLDGAVAGAMATVSGVLFLLAAVFSPRHGVLLRWFTRRRLGNVNAPEGR